MESDSRNRVQSEQGRRESHSDKLANNLVKILQAPGAIKRGFGALRVTDEDDSE